MRSRLDQARVKEEPRALLGSVKRKVVPRPSPALSAHIIPPIDSTSAREIANPTPEPPPSRERDFSTR